MKRICIALTLLITSLTLSLAQETNIILQDSANESKIEYTDTPDVSSNTHKHHSDQTFQEVFGDSGSVIAITGLIAIFGVPVLIIFIVAYFNYKSRISKYKLVEKAIASGQPLPEEFLKAKTDPNILHKGIRNVCTGLGLFIFLWALTHEFGLGCIGLLIMFTGFGQIVIHYTQNKENDTLTGKKNDNNPHTQE